MNGLRGFRMAVWLLVAVAAGLWVGLSLSQRNIDQATEISISGKARIGGPFRLISHRGDTIDNAGLAGRPYLVFFGFTFCPDICPTTLFELTDFLAKLGSDADRLTPPFITVDPSVTPGRRSRTTCLHLTGESSHCAETRLRRTQQ